MAITHFDSNSNPIDTAANSVSPVAVPPPASMVAGDLAILVAMQEATGRTLTVLEAGGQEWTALASHDSGVAVLRVFWARFNGTWTADPSVQTTSTSGPFSAVMHVFRPSNGANTWSVDVAPASANASAATTITVTGITRNASGAVALAIWGVEDDTTWTNLTGSGWSKAGMVAQYRNPAGADQGLTFAYSIGDGATGDVSQDQSAAVAGITYILAFAESGGAAVPVDGSQGQAMPAERPAGAIGMPPGAAALASGLLTSAPPFFTMVDGKRTN